MRPDKCFFRDQQYKFDVKSSLVVERMLLTRNVVDGRRVVSMTDATNLGSDRSSLYSLVRLDQRINFRHCQQSAHLYFTIK